MRKAIVITLGMIIGVAGVLAICAHLADAAKLHHRQPRLLMEPFQIGCQCAGAADAIAEDIAPARASVPGCGRPIRSL